MDAMNQGWNEAAARVEAFLAANGAGSREHLLRLTLEVLGEARATRSAEKDPVTTAMAIAHRKVDEWFGRLANTRGGPPDVTRGRIAYALVDGPSRWPSAFLAPELPAEMVAATREEAVVAGPALEFRSLVRREIDYGPISDIGRETWIQFSWKFTLQAFVIWTLVFFAALGIWIRFFE